MARQPTIPDHLKEQYFPEHDRLNRSPIIPRETQASQPKPPAPRGLPQRPPPQPRVNVGVHEDTMWFGDLSAGVPPSKVIDNNDYVDTEAVQGHNPLEPEGWHTGPEQNSEFAQHEGKSQNGLNLNQDEYAVIYGGKLIESSHDREVIMLCVEDLLLQSDANIDDIFVIKRLKINYGITIE